MATTTEPTAPATLGVLFRRAREAAGLSREVAAVSAGTSSSTIVRLERFNHRPGLDILMRLADVLDVPLAEVVDTVAADSAA